MAGFDDIVTAVTVVAGRDYQAGSAVQEAPELHEKSHVLDGFAGKLLLNFFLGGKKDGALIAGGCGVVPAGTHEEFIFMGMALGELQVVPASGFDRGGANQIAGQSSANIMTNRAQNGIAVGKTLIDGRRGGGGGLGDGAHGKGVGAAAREQSKGRLENYFFQKRIRLFGHRSPPGRR